MTTNQSTTATEQTRLSLRPVLAKLAELADAVTEQQRGGRTPCPDFDVAALTGHIVGWLENFAGGFASSDGTCPVKDVSAIEVPRSEAASRISAAGTLLDQAVRDGAAERPLVIIDQGGMPGEMALSMVLGEYLVHGWDLARATGQDWSPDPAAADAARAFLAGMVTPEYRGPGGMFGPEVEVASDATPLDRLIGFAGRTPNWTP